MKNVHKFVVSEYGINETSYFVYDENNLDYEMKFSSLSKEQVEIVNQCNGYSDSSMFANDCVCFKTRKDAEKCSIFFNENWIGSTAI